MYVVQPSADEQRPLKWSHVPITFDAADHPDRTSGVGILPLVVSPVIHNMTVMKMLVDGGAGLNLISADLLGKLQIPGSGWRLLDHSRASTWGLRSP